MTQPANNPFAAPRATVADVTGDGAATQPIRLWPPSGRLGRVRYLAYGLGGMFLLSLVSNVVLAAIGARAWMVAAPALVGVFALAFGLLLTVQRCHDLNWSGWLALLMFVPLVNLIFVVLPGTLGANRYGPPPVPNTRGVKIAAAFALAVPLIGIAAAIALPAYQAYAVKARAAQGR